MECAICLEEIPEYLKTTLRCDCKYFYHYNCIESWCKIRPQCPICKKHTYRPDLDERIDDCMKKILNYFLHLFIFPHNPIHF